MKYGPWRSRPCCCVRVSRGGQQRSRGGGGVLGGGPCAASTTARCCLCLHPPSCPGLYLRLHPHLCPSLYLRLHPTRCTSRRPPPTPCHLPPFHRRLHTLHTPSSARTCCRSCSRCNHPGGSTPTPLPSLPSFGAHRPSNHRLHTRIPPSYPSLSRLPIFTLNKTATTAISTILLRPSAHIIAAVAVAVLVAVFVNGADVARPSRDPAAHTPITGSCTCLLHHHQRPHCEPALLHVCVCMSCVCMCVFCVFERLHVHAHELWLFVLACMPHCKC